MLLLLALITLRACHEVTVLEVTLSATCLLDAMHIVWRGRFTALLLRSLARSISIQLFVSNGTSVESHLERKEDLCTFVFD